MQSGVEKLLAWLVIELTTLDLSSQSGTLGYSANAISIDLLLLIYYHFTKNIRG